MAVQAVFGGEIVWHAEIDEAASKLLAHRFPNVPNLGDVTQVNWNAVERIDILCGGFPCQDVSAAGKRAGIKAGTRSGLWSVFAETIDELRPRLVVIENVRGLLSATAHRNGEDEEFGGVESDTAVVGNGASRPILRAAGAVLGDLADLRYDAQWATVAAASVGAPHRRERVFILATDTASNGWDEGWPESARLQRGFDAAVSGDKPVDLLPTPRSSDCFGAGQHGRGGMDLRTTVSLLPTPWGKYAPAIHRWEQLTRPAPKPTEPNKNGKPRLAAPFSEWMMGWPEGWVTDPKIGLSRTDQLRIVGNGVCPQQAASALMTLLQYALAATTEAG